MLHGENSVAETIEVSSRNKSIFRSKALRSYSDREQQPASYTLVTPRSLFLLWALLVLVVFFGLITWLARIPVYTPAVAVGINGAASENETPAATIIVILVAADHLNKLHVGQNVVFKFNATHHNVIAQIFSVEPEVLTPQAARKRFDPGAPFSNIAEPKAVALARLDPQSSNAWLFNYRGGSIDAWVETDSKPVLSLFPLRARILQPPDQLETAGMLACSRSGLVPLSHARKGEFFERYPVRASSCFLRKISLQTTNKQQNEGGSLYV